jgi:parallel beta-helix repeat protein
VIHSSDLRSSTASSNRHFVSSVMVLIWAIAVMTLWTGPTLAGAAGSQGPIASFTYSPASPVVGSAVSFDGSSSTCSPKPCSYIWTDDASGSQFATGAKVFYTFQSSGTKYVRLTITDGRSRTASVEHNVTVSTASVTSPPPVPAFTYSPFAPVTGSAVSFNGSSSSCVVTPCSYSWTDDADGSLLGTGVTMSFTFKQVGTKYVRLTVTDSKSQVASVEQNVVVSQSSSAPSITSFTPASGIAGVSVTISGANFTGASAVRFNGVNASFTVSSSTTIQAIVPAAAATGPLSVTTAAGIATSGNAFTVSAAPIPQFTFSPLSPSVGSPVSFDASASTCFAAPCSYRWSNDVDGSQLGTGVTISVTFQQAATAKVRMTITDSQSQVASIEHDVVVAQTSTPPSNAYYVSASGSDSNAGTSVSPWKTIQKAANTLNAGDTVIVTAGTYNERISISRSGSSGKPITFLTQGTVLTEGFNISASYINVSAFQIANTPGTSATDRSNGSGFYLSGSNNVISGNTIQNSTAAGIYFTGSSNNSTVSGNRITYAVECGIYIQGSGNLIVSNDISHTRDVNGSDADGVRFFGSGNTVRQNYIHDIMLSDSPGQSPHIDAFQTWGPATNYVFEQNLVDKSPSQNQAFTIEGLTQPVGNIMIRNNVFITRGTGYEPDVNAGDVGLVTNVSVIGNTMAAVNGSVEYAVWLFQNLSGAVVKDNAIYNHGNSSVPYIQVDAGASGLDIGFNSVYTSNGVAPQGSAYSGDLWMVNPLFVNVSGGNFHLQSTSPLIDRGMNLSGLTNDYDGTARPFGLLTDMGAFEFHAP